MRAAIFAMLILGCEQTSYDERTVKLVLSDDIRAECGPSFLDPHGCARLHGKHCTIVARRPRGFDDDERIKTLGHELWHCFTGARHT